MKIGLAALVALLPVQALACEGVTRHFMLCAEGSAWAAAEWDQFGDGVTVNLGPFAFDSVEDWAGREEGVNPRVDVALEALMLDNLAGQINVDHLRDSFQTPDLTVARAVRTVTFKGDPPIQRAYMIAEGGGARVLLMLTAPADISPEVVAEMSRGLADIVRPSGEE